MPTTRSQQQSVSHPTDIVVQFMKLYLELNEQTKHPPPNQYDNKYIKKDSNTSIRQPIKPVVKELYKQDVCNFGSQCCNFECNRIHPKDVIQKCELGSRCNIKECDKLHPKSSICKFGRNCINYECNRIHPIGSRIKCSFGSMCTSKICKAIKLHPNDLK